MRRKGPISGLLFMGVLIALGTMGLVYGTWSETLSINGNVQTGDVNVSIEAKTADEGGDTKDVASCSSVATDTDSNSKDDKVTVTITNAFPGYSCHFWTNIVNSGSLPVSVTAVLKTTAGSALDIVRSDDNTVLPKGDCENTQLMPGATEFCDWTITVLKNAVQDTIYEFSVNIDAELINKPEAGG